MTHAVMHDSFCLLGGLLEVLYLLLTDWHLNSDPLQS